MQKYISKNSKSLQRAKSVAKTPQDKSVRRLWGNATRLEHINNRGKGKL